MTCNLQFMPAQINCSDKVTCKTSVVLVLRNEEVACNIPSKLVQDVIFSMVPCPSPYESLPGALRDFPVLKYLRILTASWSYINESHLIRGTYSLNGSRSCNN